MLPPFMCSYYVHTISGNKQVDASKRVYIQTEKQEREDLRHLSGIDVEFDDRSCGTVEKRTRWRIVRSRTERRVDRVKRL